MIGGEPTLDSSEGKIAFVNMLTLKNGVQIEECSMSAVNDSVEAKVAATPSEQSDKSEVTPVSEVQDRIETIEIDRIDFGQQNPRRKIDEDAITNLAMDIKINGLLQPILVRPVADRFEVVAGERRFRACRLALLKTVRCVVRELDDKRAFLIAFAENDKRVDLSPMDEAHAFHRMKEKYGMSLREIGEKAGKSHQHVRNRLLLLNLIPGFESLLERDAVDLKSAENIATWSTDDQWNFLDATCSRLQIDIKTIEMLSDSRVVVFKQEIKANAKRFSAGLCWDPEWQKEMIEKRNRRLACGHIADATEVLAQNAKVYGADKDIEALAKEFASKVGVSAIIGDRLTKVIDFLEKLHNEIARLQTPPKPVENPVVPAAEANAEPSTADI